MQKHIGRVNCTYSCRCGGCKPTHEHWQSQWSGVLPLNRWWSCMLLSPCCPRCYWWVYTGPPRQSAAEKHRLLQCMNEYCQMFIWMFVCLSNLNPIAGDVKLNLSVLKHPGYSPVTFPLREIQLRHFKYLFSTCLKVNPCNLSISWLKYGEIIVWNDWAWCYMVIMTYGK